MQAKVFGERYRTLQLLATGGMGSVFAAEDLRSGSQVAVKVVHQRLADREQTVERFRREALLLHQIDHPGVVRILDSGIDEDGLLFLVMELLHGETLGARLERGPMPANEVAGLVAAIADVLEAIHRAGLVHRDLKPSNVFLRRPTDGAHVPDVKLIDFGIAKAIQLGRLTATGEMLGTPRFMSPEQLRTPHAVDHRADIFALAVLTYTSISGRAPFPDEPAAAIAASLEGRALPINHFLPNAPADLASLFERALSVEPNLRPPSARAFADAFGSAVSGPGVAGSSSAPIAKTVRLDADSLPAPAPPSPIPSTSSRPVSNLPRPHADTVVAPWSAPPALANRPNNGFRWVLAGTVLAIFGVAGGSMAWLLHEPATHPSTSLLQPSTSLLQPSTSLLQPSTLRNPTKPSPPRRPTIRKRAESRYCRNRPEQ